MGTNAYNKGKQENVHDTQTQIKSQEVGETCYTKFQGQRDRVTKYSEPQQASIETRASGKTVDTKFVRRGA